MYSIKKLIVASKLNLFPVKRNCHLQLQCAVRFLCKIDDLDSQYYV